MPSTWWAQTGWWFSCDNNTKKRGRGKTGGGEKGEGRGGGRGKEEEKENHDLREAKVHRGKKKNETGTRTCSMLLTGNVLYLELLVQLVTNRSCPD